MRVRKEDLPVALEAGAAFSRQMDMGNMTVAYDAVPAGFDSAAIDRGLPGDRCPCPHWGYVLKGRVRVTYADREEIYTAGKPSIDVEIMGTDLIREVEIVRAGAILHSLNPETEQAEFRYVDESFQENSYYYLRVTQADKDKHGNLSRAWSSPIWVRSRD